MKFKGMKKTEAYIKVYAETNFTRRGKKKNKHPFDIAHGCRICGHMYRNIQDHLQSRHKENKAVAVIMAIKREKDLELQKEKTNIERVCELGQKDEDKARPGRR